MKNSLHEIIKERLENRLEWRNYLGWLLTHRDLQMMARKKYYEDMLSRIPLGRLATPEDVAHLSLFLASRQNTYITGQNIHISGGLL